LCVGCGKNFATLKNEKKLISNNSYFVSGYNVMENDDDLFIYYAKIKSDVKKNNDSENCNYALDFVQKEKYVRFNKSTSKLFFKDVDELEFEFDLDQVIEICNNIFVEETPDIHNLYYIQLYISKIAKHVIDISNTNIIEEILTDVRNRFNYAGLDIIKKAVSIFFAIIKYSNLSTIALTKGCSFFYDLMKECQIPKSQKFVELGLTSPIPIFNHLVGNYIKKINEEVNEDNKDVHEFIFKSNKSIKIETDEKDKEQEAKSFSVVENDVDTQMKITYKQNKKYKEGKIKHNSNTNRFHVMEISNDASASKFIYNKIKKFSDYKNLLKYFKFYNKHQIIYLLQKYELELLVKIIDVVYFRDVMNIKELERIILIISDFVTQESMKSKPFSMLDNQEVHIDYSHVFNFDFTYYDDSLMMMEILEFDPKRQFNKIKTYGELVVYHDNLVKYFNIVSDKEKNQKFKTFVDKFKFLESREDYDGPIWVRLITTPSMLINEGVTMKHSASSYSKKVITESYLIAQVFDKTEDLSKDELVRFIIGFTFDSVNGLEFDQVKGFGNKSGTDRFKKLLMDFLTIKDVSYRPIKDLKIKNIIE